jgi:hypothetical protein
MGFKITVGKWPSPFPPARDPNNHPSRAFPLRKESAIAEAEEGEFSFLATAWVKKRLAS